MNDKKENVQKIISNNRKAGFDYSIIEKIESGIVLKGSEVKSCREGKVQLADSYASIERNELYLYKAHIAEYRMGGPYFNHEVQRKRKLLIHKREINRLSALIEQKGYTIIPLKVYLKNGKVKVELGLAKGKTKGDKRQSIKGKEVKREINRSLKRGRFDD